MTTTGGEPKYSARGGWATTARVVRHDPVVTFDIPVARLQPTPPPVLVNPPRPAGDLSTATADEILAVAESVWAHSNHLRLRLRAGIPALLSELEQARENLAATLAGPRPRRRHRRSGRLGDRKEPRAGGSATRGSCSACGSSAPA